MRRSKERVEFGTATFGASEAMAAVTASFPDGRRWIVSPLQMAPGPDMVARFARILFSKAKRMAAEEACERFLPEMLAYVRSLPPGRRSDSLESQDSNVRAAAEDDVRQALASALEKEDAFRAAVEFETRVPYLVGDRGLMAAMDAVHADFCRDYDELSWAATVAELTEESLRRDYPFANAPIAAWRSGGILHSR